MRFMGLDTLRLGVLALAPSGVDACGVVLREAEVCAL
jgi:hypothetical protein